MHINRQIMTGKQFHVDPGLQDAWQEIVDIFPELEEMAEWDCLQVRLLKVIPLSESSREMSGLDRAEMRFTFKKKTGLPTIQVIDPRCLAYGVAWYIDHAYGLANYQLRKAESQIYYSSTHECEAALEMMMDVGFEFAEDYWRSITLLEQTIYQGNKQAAFARAFEIGIAAIIYKAGRKPISCSKNVELLDPDNPTHNREEMEIEGNPYYGFALSWHKFESWWFQSTNALIHDTNEMTTKFCLVPENMMPGAI